MTKGGPSPTSILAGDYAADGKYPHQYFPANEAMLEHFDRFTVDAKFRLRFNAARFLSQSKADNAPLVEVLREVIDVPLGVIAAVSSCEAADDYQPMYSADEYAEKYGDGTTGN